jgi:hypothetical protein
MLAASEPSLSAQATIGPIRLRCAACALVATGRSIAALFVQPSYPHRTGIVQTKWSLSNRAASSGAAESAASATKRDCVGPELGPANGVIRIRPFQPRDAETVAALEVRLRIGTAARRDADGVSAAVEGWAADAIAAAGCAGPTDGRRRRDQDGHGVCRGRSAPGTGLALAPPTPTSGCWWPLPSTRAVGSVAPLSTRPGVCDRQRL